MMALNKTQKHIQEELHHAWTGFAGFASVPVEGERPIQDTANIKLGMQQEQRFQWNLH